MPGPNISDRRAAFDFPKSLLGALVMGVWIAAPRTDAAPFRADNEMPSVLTAPMESRQFAAPSGEPVYGVEAEGGRSDVGQGRIMAEAYDCIPVDDARMCSPDATCHDGRLSDPVGLLQYLHACCEKRGTRWIGRTDALLLWRDAPSSRPIVDTGALPAATALDADQLPSTATGGVRASILQLDGCSGNGWETSYMYAGKFTAGRDLPVADFPYALAPPGIYGNNSAQPFDLGTATLFARLQGAELNRLIAGGPSVRWLAGFRWVQWHEQFSLQNSLVSSAPPINDLYQTTCDNNLYGGQIGVDARLLTLGVFRIDSVVKSGAFYNNAVQTSTYTTDAPANPGTASVQVGQSPAACSFVGEVGLTGVLPITCNLDFRFGYLGLWLTGLAQPTKQLSGQQITPGLANVGTITANGGTFVQGLTLGLEGRW